MTPLPLKKLTIDEMNRQTVGEFKQSSKLPLVIVLDNVRSLFNIGSVFRTCDAFAVKAIYLCGISAKPPHREIHKTALGAENSVDWKYFETTLQAIEYLKADSYAVWGVELTQNSISLENFTVKPRKRYALLFGNEVHGISQEALDCCEGCIEIPQFGTKHSLNVSVSAGIVVWECYKKINSERLTINN